MFKIGEFAKLTKVSKRMLRYYDEMDLLKPAVIDPLTGYRFYSTEQIPTLQKILLLRDMEFNISEIAVVLDNWDRKKAAVFLAAKKQEILDNIELERQRIHKIEIAIQDFENDQIEIHYNVAIKEIPSFKILSIREMIPDHFCEGDLWSKLYAFVEKESVEFLPGINNLAIFHNEENIEHGVDVEVGVLVKKLGLGKEGFQYRETEAVPTMACMMVYGPYENIGPAYHSFAYWLEAHRQYEMAGPSRQICHIGAFNEVSPDQYLTEIQVPVRIST